MMTVLAVIGALALVVLLTAALAIAWVVFMETADEQEVE